MITAEIHLDSVFVCEDESKSKLLRQGFGTISTTLRIGAPPALILMDEEAMYMTQRGILQVPTVDNLADTLWTMFCRKYNAFPFKYKTYKYFKENGFSVKSGTNFGMDYAIYRLTPSSSHSEFCVRVISDSMDDNGNDWRSISTITRVMPDVMKICILSVVNFLPSISNQPRYEDLFEPTSSGGSSAVTLNSIDCLDQLDIKLLSTVIRRLPVTKENYLTIGQWQAKYRKLTTKTPPSMVQRNAAIDPTFSKKSDKKNQRKRRNHLEIRSKGKSSKSGIIWESLNSATAEPAKHNEELMK